MSASFLFLFPDDLAPCTVYNISVVGSAVDGTLSDEKLSVEMSTERVGEYCAFGYVLLTTRIRASLFTT